MRSCVVLLKKHFLTDPNGKVTRGVHLSVENIQPTYVWLEYKPSKNANQKFVFRVR